MTGSAKLDGIIGLFCTISVMLSSFMSWVNSVLRARVAEGQETAPWLLRVAALLNLVSANADKAAQLAALAKTKGITPVGEAVAAAGASVVAAQAAEDGKTARIPITMMADVPVEPKVIEAPKAT